MAVQVLLFGSGPEMVRSLRSHRSLRPKGPGHSGPVFFGACDLLVVRLWIGVRRYTGDGPESPVHRSLRSTGPGMSGLKFFSALCFAVVRYWIGVRRDTGSIRSLRPLWPGITGLPSPEGAWSLAGISGPGQSLRPTYIGVSGLGRVQQLVFERTYKMPPSSPFDLRFSAARISLSLAPLLTLENLALSKSLQLFLPIFRETREET